MVGTLPFLALRAMPGGLPTLRAAKPRNCDQFHNPRAMFPNIKIISS
jgi:hypothetical protein